MARMAWGAGLATIASDDTVLDTWYRWLGWGEFGDDDCPTDEIENALGMRDTTDATRRVTIRPVRISVDVDAPPASPSDAYLRLHLLSHRLAAAADAEPRRHLRRVEQRGVDRSWARSRCPTSRMCGWRSALPAAR